MSAGSAHSNTWFFRITDTAAAKGPLSTPVNLRIKTPALFPGGRVKRNDTVKWGAENQRLAGFQWQQNRGGLSGRIFHLVTVGCHISTTENPGHIQFIDVVCIDLRGWGIMPAALVTAVIKPARARGTGCVDGKDKNRYQSQVGLSHKWVIKAQRRAQQFAQVSVAMELCAIA